MGWRRRPYSSSLRVGGGPLQKVLPHVTVGITLPSMTTISLKLPEELLREIEQEAATRGVPKSAVIRDSLERTLRKGLGARKKVTCLDLVRDLVGKLDGPPDGSTNPCYLEEASLADRHRRGQKNCR